MKVLSGCLPKNKTDKKNETKTDTTSDDEKTSDGDSTDTANTEKPTDGGSNSMILIIGAVALIGGGTFYYFKIHKGKPKKPKAPQYDEEEDVAKEESCGRFCVSESAPTCGRFFDVFNCKSSMDA